MLLPKISFLFKQSQFAYSLLIIILIPLALVLNTLWVLRSVDRDVSLQLRQEALLVGAVLGNLTSDRLGQTPTLNSQLAKIKKEQAEIKNISLLTKDENSQLRAIASTSSLNEKSTDEALAQFVLSSGVAHAALVKDPAVSEKVWSVIAPIKDDYGKVIALADVKISTAEIDALFTRSTRDSIIVLAITIVFILLLLINHLRFFEYARLFRKLQEVDQMKDDFISMASHELRTPLTAIRGFAQLLVEDISKQKPDQAQKDAVIINESSSRLNDLVDDLLNVSRLEGGRLNFDLKPININEIILKVVQELQVQANQKGLKVVTTLLDNPPLVLSDEMRVKQVFTNLVGNSIKYTLQGEIKISQKLEGKNLHTTVEDTGVGMSAQSREHLFEKFYRVRTEATKDIGGTGLGLWITKQIVERMKGKIYVDSMEGKGSLFTVVFPVVE
jgi:signal transduction histidine kinase